jgi:hypothetical protein
MNLRAKLKKAPRHRFAESGAATRDKDTPACKELFAEHGKFPLCKMLVGRLSD